MHTKELVKLYSNPRLNAVTDISHARMLAIAIRLADHYSQSDREEMLRIYQREVDQQHTQRNYHSRDKGAR